MVELRQSTSWYGQVSPNFILYGGKMRFRLKKTVQYVFIAFVVILLWHGFDQIEKTPDADLSRGESHPGPVPPYSGGKDPLVAGIKPLQQRAARRSAGAAAGVDDGGRGVQGNFVGALGREPLWQDGSNNNNNNNDNHISDQLSVVKARIREDGSEVESKDISAGSAHVVDNSANISKNRTKPKDDSALIGKLKNITRSKDGDQPIKAHGQLFSVAINEPKIVEGQIPPIPIKDLSSLVAMKQAPTANFTIVVHNPAPENIPFDSKPHTDRQTELSDVFIGVKTTEKYHKDRLQIILDTWYSLAPEQTFFFTDIDDTEFQQKSNGHMINTQCQGTHSRLALCCKTSVIFNMFYKSDKRWLCHVDDDNYLNVPELMKLLRQYDHTQDYYLGRASLSHPIEAIDRSSNQRVSFWFATGGAGFCISRSLAKKMAVYASSGTFERMCNRIRLPDDVTIGFIVEVLLKQPLTKVQGFNSHLQQLRSIKSHQLQKQITLSYSITDKRVNIINMPSTLFSIDQDPTRFKTFHCTYFRGFGNCPTR